MARGAGHRLRRASRAAGRAPPRPEPTRVRPSPRPPPGAMEPEPGGVAAALLRQKRAALRRRGCSFESPRYRGPGGVRPGGAEAGSRPRGGWGAVWGDRGLRGRGAGRRLWGALRGSGEEPGPSGGGSRGRWAARAAGAGGVTPEKNQRVSGTQTGRDAPKASVLRQAPSRAGLQADFGLWRMCRAASCKCSRTRSGNSSLKSQGGLPPAGTSLRCPRTQATCSLRSLAWQVSHTCCLTAPPILEPCGPLNMPGPWVPSDPRTPFLCWGSPCPSRPPRLAWGTLLKLSCWVPSPWNLAPRTRLPPALLCQTHSLSGHFLNSECLLPLQRSSLAKVGPALSPPPPPSRWLQ